jgi:pantoate--beta-alanine ligase
MDILRTVNEIRCHTGLLNSRPAGFVPTMGALHEGHLSLVRTAINACPIVTVSIFVNPTQFNDSEDFARYPRTEEKDLELLKKVLRKNDVVFIPAVKEIYPEEDRRKFSFGTLENVMEGLHRPGHFNGVAQVVSKLFDIVKPDIAYFGKKDFQQLAIIRELVRQTGSGVRIEPCPIIREEDGLAMSSRNQLLETEIRARAGIIFKTLKDAAAMVQNNEIDEIKQFVKNTIDSTSGFRTDYFEIVDDTSLIPVSSKKEMDRDKRYQGCIALKAGKIRLIDNIELTLA